MRLATIISLGASAVFGIGALFVARLWLPAHTASAQSMPVRPVASEGQSVVVAAAPIAYGAKLDAQFLKVVRLPASSVPAGAFASVNQILSQPGGPPLALAQFAAQEPILPSKITGPGERQTLAALIDPSMRAYTIGVTDVSGGAGHVMPGDRVDVVMTRDVTPAGANAAPTARRIASEVVLQDVRVLGMDQNANPTTTQTVVARTATLEVSVQDTVRLALAVQTGSLSLALRRTGEAALAPVRPLAGSDVSTASAESAGLRGATGGRVRRATAAAAAGEGDVTVINGDVASKQKVALERAGASF